MIRRELQAFILIAILGSIAIFGLWQFEWRWLGMFDNSLAQFDGEHLTPSAKGRVTVQQFRDPSCPCNRYVRKHTQELEAQFRPQGVNFEVVDPVINGSVNIPSSPAVAIWTAQGELAYFGPYSNGVICNSNTSLIEPVLHQINAGDNPSITNTAGVGCFCPWPKKSVKA